MSNLEFGVENHTVYAFGLSGTICKESFNDHFKK
jgi:hypothetical protein